MVAELEQTAAEVRLVMVRRSPKRMLNPNPYLHASQVPLRTAYMLDDSKQWLCLGWEDWTQLAPSQRVAPLESTGAPRAAFLVMVYGAPLGSTDPPRDDAPCRRRRDSDAC